VGDRPGPGLARRAGLHRCVQPVSPASRTTSSENPVLSASNTLRPLGSTAGPGGGRGGPRSGASPWPRCCGL